MAEPDFSQFESLGEDDGCISPGFSNNGKSKKDDTEEFQVVVDQLKHLGRLSMVDSSPMIHTGRGSSVRVHLTNDNVENLTNPTNYSELGCLGLVEDLELEGVFTTTEKILTEGKDHINMLYTFRSAAKALPVVGPSHNEEEKYDIYKKTFEILNPQIEKLSSLRVFQGQVCEQFKILFERLGKSKNALLMGELKKQFLIRLLDVLIILDLFKDIKPCLQNDFSFYKRSLHMVKGELSAEKYEELNKKQEQLQFFLSDPRCPKGVMINNLKEKICSVAQITKTLSDLLHWVAHRIHTNEFTLPEEKWQLTRSMPYLVFLLDSCEEGFNVYKAKKVLTPDVLKLLKQNPVIPVYGDVQLITQYVFARSPHYDSNSVADMVCVDPMTDPKASQLYLINSTMWKSIRGEYDVFLSTYSQVLNKFRTSQNEMVFNKPKNLMKEEDHNSKSNNNNMGDSADLDVSIYNILLEGIDLLSKWKNLVVSQYAFKFAKSAQDVKLDHYPGVDYDRAVRYNYSKTELMILIDLISLIKSLAATIQNDVHLLLPSVHRSSVRSIKLFFKNLLEKVENSKKKKTLRDLLEKIQLVFGFEEFTKRQDESSTLQQQQNDDTQQAKTSKKKRRFKFTSSSSSSRNVTAPEKQKSALPPTICETYYGVGLSFTQIQVLRSFAHFLQDEEVDGKQSAAKRFFTGKENGKSQRKFDHFFDIVRSFPLLENLEDTLDSLSNFGHLWYREFYLDITKSTQFPIDMSLPWILIKEIVENPSLHTTNSLFYMMDLYNDTASMALYQFKQQYLWEEIEAEVDLVVDQMLYLLPTHIYSHYKSMVTYNLLDPNYRYRVSKLKNIDVGKRQHLSFQNITSQRSIYLLGRELNIGSLLSDHLHLHMRGDIDLALKRFEAGNICCTLELDTQLNVLRKVHDALLQLEGIQFTPFDEILAQVNENEGITCFNGRIAAHINSELIMDIMPNYDYNMTTERFTKSVKVENPIDRCVRPRASDPSYLFGSDCGKLYDVLHKQKRGFLGDIHIEAITNLIGRELSSAICEQILSQIEYRIEQVVLPLSHGILKRLSTNKLPLLNSDFEKVFQEYKTLFESIFDSSSDTNMRVRIFQTFREIGNGFMLLKLFQRALDKKDLEICMIAYPFISGSSKTSTPLDSISNILALSNTQKRLLNKTKRLYSSCNKQTMLFQTVLEHIRDRYTNSMKQVEFQKVWGALQFLYCITDVTNSNMFGDGIIIAGSLFIYLFGKKSSFTIDDISFHLQRMKRYTKETNNSSCVGRKLFNENFEKVLKMNKRVFSLLDGYDLQTISVDETIFHPPLSAQTNNIKNMTPPKMPGKKALVVQNDNNTEKPKHLRRSLDRKFSHEERRKSLGENSSVASNDSLYSRVEDF